MGMQLVPAGEDTGGAVHAIGPDGFELADDGAAIGGDRRADARNDRIVARQALAVVMHLRRKLVDGHVAACGVDDFHGMAAGFAHLHQTAG